MVQIGQIIIAVLTTVVVRVGGHTVGVVWGRLLFACHEARSTWSRLANTQDLAQQDTHDTTRARDSKESFLRNIQLLSATSESGYNVFDGLRNWIINTKTVCGTILLSYVSYCIFTYIVQGLFWLTLGFLSFHNPVYHFSCFFFLCMKMH